MKSVKPINMNMMIILVNIVVRKHIILQELKISGVTSYVAYNKDLALVDTYQGSVADSKDVQQAIEQKYQIVIDDLEVGYENERFVYYGRYQEDESLLYVYYDLMSGEFIKAVRLG